MSTAENKLNLVQMIVESNDKTFISKILEYANSLKTEKSIDWADELPEEVIQKLEKSIHQSKTGQVKSHDQVIENLNKRYSGIKLG
ncbi:MAG: hypothetical protein ACK46Y_13390 [Fluviicola sp.]